MDITHQVHCLGNGHLCVYGDGADIMQAFGPNYSAPDSFSAKADAKFVTEKISYRQYVHKNENCVITDYIDEKLPVLYRTVKGPVKLVFDLKNAVISPSPYDSTFFALTYEGAPVYTYDFHKDGRPKAYTYPKKRYTGIGYHGGVTFERLSDVMFEFVCSDCTLVFAFADTAEEVFGLLDKPVPEFTLPARLMSADRYRGAVEDGYDVVASQQSYNGSVLAGYNYHLCYIRDNYGVLRFLLACKAFDRAKLLLEYYISVFDSYGKIHNAQGMAEYAFHVHENDRVEITGYIVLMFVKYYETTSDDGLLRRAVPLIEYCLRCQHEAMVGDVLPFNGDETYVAGGFMPRSALNDGSAEATSLYHLSAVKILGLQNVINIKAALCEKIKADAALIKKNYKKNFIYSGKLYANKPDIGYSPDFRHGVRGCGHGFGISFRNENGDYVCPDCLDKHIPPCYEGEYGRRYATEAAVLCPAFTGTELIPEEIIRDTAKRVLDSYKNRTGFVGYEYGLLLYARGYDTEIAGKMLGMRDKFGAWSEYYKDGAQHGTLYRTWETSLNLAALIECK